MHERRLPRLLIGVLSSIVLFAWASPAAAKDLSPKDVKINAQGVGPIRATTKATLEELTRLLPGFEVESHTRKVDGVNSIVFVVSYVGQPVLEVLSGAKDALVSVRVVSADVDSPVEGLGVGGTLDDPTRLASCKLVGEKGADGTSCKLKGIEHVAFRFALGQDAWPGTGLPAAEVIKGAKLVSLQWTP